MHISASDALLLRALLCRPPEAEEAWNKWTDTSARSGWLEALSPYKRVWPLILWAARRNRLHVPRSVLIALRAAYASEKIRHTYLRHILEACISRLSAAGVTPIVRGGVALALTVYPEAPLRHTHAIRLGVADVDGASTALSDLGFCSEEDAMSRTGRTVRLTGQAREALVLEPNVCGSTVCLSASQIVVQSPLDALAAAWDEIIGAGAYPLVWTFDVFFVAGVDRHNGRRSNDVLLAQAVRTLARVLGADPSSA